MTSVRPIDIGIDLGTTFSVIAVDGRVALTPDYPAPIYLEECDVTIIPSPYGEPTFPSVLVDDPERTGQFLFGADALQRADEGALPVMFSKRKIGTRERIPLGTGSVSAGEFAAAFLRYLKECAQRALGRPVGRAVVTHPAYFDPAAVEETRKAALNAGFDMSLPDQLLMEPAAAALAYTRTDKRDPLRILTFDLGGGTFDVTFLERRLGVLHIRGFDGDPLLGGYNFDRELVTWLRRRLESHGREVVYDESDPEDRGRLSRLLRIAEKVKIDLANAKSDATRVEFRGRDVALDAQGKPVLINESISRAEFVDLIRPYLDRTIESSLRALSKAHVSPHDLDEVLLVGGSTYGPWVAAAVNAAFPAVRPKLFHPDLCVGAGAAIHARMVLPELVAGDAWTLTLEVPESTALSSIDVGGRLTDRAGIPPQMPARVELVRAEGETLGALDLAPDGRFLLEGIVLDDAAPNRFVLRFCRSGGSVPLLDHQFQITCSSSTSDTSGFCTVLPRPLFVETQDGLVPLAKEGSTLPAQVERTFERQNDNPNISLRLFQESDPIGEIRIESIPPTAGRGAFVDLKLQVTARNQVRGTARIRSRGGEVVAQNEVLVRLAVPEVPPLEHLRSRFEELREECDEAEDAAEADAPGAASRICDEVEHLLDQQPVERQEVHAALQRLAAALHPPEDEMHPTRAEYLRVLARCRAALDLAAEAESAPDSGPSGRHAPRAGGAAAAPPPAGPAARARNLLDRLESDGLAAHDRRDRKSWGTCYDALTDVEAQLRKSERPKSPPTPVLKLMASLQVMAKLDRVREQARTLAGRGRLDDWKAEIERILAGMEEVLQTIGEIPDGVPEQQGRAQIQAAFARRLKPLEEDIERLGIDIREGGK